MIYLCAECAKELSLKGTPSKEQHECKLCGRISFGVEVRNETAEMRVDKRQLSKFQEV